MVSQGSLRQTAAIPTSSNVTHQANVWRSGQRLNTSCAHLWRRIEREEHVVAGPSLAFLKCSCDPEPVLLVEVDRRDVLLEHTSPEHDATHPETPRQIQGVRHQRRA